MAARSWVDAAQFSLRATVHARLFLEGGHLLPQGFQLAIEALDNFIRITHMLITSSPKRSRVDGEKRGRQLRGKILARAVRPDAIPRTAI